MDDYREIGPPGNGKTRKPRASSLAAVRETARHVELHANHVIFRGALYNNLGAPGPSVEDFATQYASSVSRSPNWLWGEASLVASYTYDPSGYPDIYFLIGRDGIVQEIAPAPHVTMNIILEFAEGAKVSRIEK